MRNNYDDIIHLSRPVSDHHAPMSRKDRAAQFSSFAALTGYEDAIQETGRLTDHWQGPDEEARQLLDERFRILRTCIAEEPEITVTRFVPDPWKDGGSFERMTAAVRIIDDLYHCLHFRDGSMVSFASIVSLEGDLFLRDIAQTDERDVP